MSAGARPLPGARRVLVAGAAGGVLWLLVWGLLSALMVGSDLPPDAMQALVDVLGPKLPVLVVVFLAAAAVAAQSAHWAWKRWLSPADAMVEEARVLLSTDVERQVRPRGTQAMQGLAQAFNDLATQRRQLRADMAAQVRQASRHVEQERNRLAALMSELSQSVVVCNLDGRILLYNSQARAQFRALSSALALAGGAEAIGLGRSVYSVLDRHLVSHAIERVQQRMARGEARPSAQFVTTTGSSQLLRVHLSPVLVAEVETQAQTDAGAAGTQRIDGFVLMLDNITRNFEVESTRDRELNELMESQRAALGNLQAAVEMLDLSDLDAPTRERFLGVVRSEALRMIRGVQAWSQASAQDMGTRWPLEEMLGADLVAVARRRLEELPNLRVVTDEVDEAVWLKVDSYSLLLALAYLADRLTSEYGIRQLALRLQAVGARAQLDLIWTGQSMSTETVMSWEIDGIQIGGQHSSQLSVRDVVQRHGGEFWFERERVRHQAFFRFLLPGADTQAVVAAAGAAGYVHSDSRPEYYDFDLFASRRSHEDLEDRRLVDLVYTVFDTETTGLNPSEGDEIIQIGATRVLNGKLIKQESFEQLVDPCRPIPAASIPIHGIQPEMVQGQPTIEQVLPAFHAFANETVLVAHNAAFDMRFLQLKEERTGLRFDHAVLDTLLLSAVVHPNQESHRLEAIAERFEINVIGRHTALGDAMVTAEVLIRLIPLLAEKGIHTLRQAREAQQQTYYARLKY